VFRHVLERDALVVPVDDLAIFLLMIGDDSPQRRFR
jgi:hypothetical protein